MKRCLLAYELVTMGGEYSATRNCHVEKRHQMIVECNEKTSQS